MPTVVPINEVHQVAAAGKENFISNSAKNSS
jgi:hypothetical protein